MVLEQITASEVQDCEMLSGAGSAKESFGEGGMSITRDIDRFFNADIILRGGHRKKHHQFHRYGSHVELTAMGDQMMLWLDWFAELGSCGQTESPMSMSLSRLSQCYLLTIWQNRNQISFERQPSHRLRVARS